MWRSKAVGVCAAAAAGGLVAWAMLSSEEKGGSDDGNSGRITISSEPGTLGDKGPGKKIKAKDTPPPPPPSAPALDFYFGSQTGTAETFAKELAVEGRERGYQTRAIDMRHMNPASDLPGTNAIFLVATYGDGDPTDNAKNCTKWMKEEATEGSLKGMRFAVFGLGNTLYEPQYNTMGKLYDDKCASHGGTRLFDLGLGDDDGTMQEDFDQWREQFWPAMGEAFGLEQSSASWLEQGVQYRLKFGLHATEAEAVKAMGRVPVSSNTLDKHATVEMRVTVNRELHNGGSRSCRHIELDMGSAPSRPCYVTGDHVAIFPANNADQVAALASRIGVDLSQWISVEDTSGACPFPAPCLVERALSSYVDINGPPKKCVIVALAEMAADPFEKQRLTHLTLKEGREEMYAYVKKGKRNILDLLNDFPSVRISIAQLVELLPRLQPRYYSISSASNTHPTSVHVTAAVVKEDAPGGGRVFRGVCTTYLDACKEGDAVTAFLRTTTFHLPPDPKTPVIMVGAGTGIAPLRGMIQHLVALKKEGVELGENMFIFGCRYRSKDYLYEQEVAAAKHLKVLTHVHTAFSRDDEFKKVYVQHRIDERSRKIFELFDQGAHFYVCGGALMAKDVRKALISCLIFLRNMRDGKADAYLEQMAAEGRYHQDVWS